MLQPGAVCRSEVTNEKNHELPHYFAFFQFLVVFRFGFRRLCPPVIYQAGNGPNCIAVEDFNRDGNIDIAVSNAFSNDVSVFLGNGDGTLQPAVNYAVGNSPGCVTQVLIG